MNQCARCGLPHIGSGVHPPCGPEPECIIACRDRQIAAQAALLRSVTGKLEEAAEHLGYTPPNSDEAATLITSVLEVLS